MNAVRRSPTSQRQKDASACSSSVSDKLAVAHMAADSSDASLERLDISTQRDLDFLATVAADALLDWIDNSVQAYLDILTENSVDASMALLSTSIQSMEEDTIDDRTLAQLMGMRLLLAMLCAQCKGMECMAFEVQELYAGRSAK